MPKRNGSASSWKNEGHLGKNHAPGLDGRTGHVCIQIPELLVEQVGNTHRYETHTVRQPVRDRGIGGPEVFAAGLESMVSIPIPNRWNPNQPEIIINLFPERLTDIKVGATLVRLGPLR